MVDDMEETQRGDHPVTAKSGTLKVSVVAGLAGVILLSALLVMHMLGTDPNAAQSTHQEVSSEAADGSVVAPASDVGAQDAHSGHETIVPDGHVMPDGSIMGNDVMPTEDPSTETTAALADPHAGHDMTPGDAAVETQSSATIAASPDTTAAPADAHEDVAGGQQAMTGEGVDWQAIVLILALVATVISLATGVKEYLRRQIVSGALADREAGRG